MTMMLLIGLLHCLLFMLSSAAIAPQSKLIADLQLHGMESRIGTRAPDVRPNVACSEIGGVCINHKSKCPLNYPLMTERWHPYCQSKWERCCYSGQAMDPSDCPAEDGCFFLYASNQCFCVIENTPDYTFEQSRELCGKRGWILPHPTDAIALRSEIVQHYGNCDNLWLNAKAAADGQYMVWQDNDVGISDSSSLFQEGSSFASTDCLQTIANEPAIASNPEKPYFSTNCDNGDLKYLPAHTLCEHVKKLF